MGFVSLSILSYSRGSTPVSTRQANNQPWHNFALRGAQYFRDNTLRVEQCAAVGRADSFDYRVIMLWKRIGCFFGFFHWLATYALKTARQQQIHAIASNHAECNYVVSAVDSCVLLLIAFKHFVSQNSSRNHILDTQLHITSTLLIWWPNQPQKLIAYHVATGNWATAR